MSVIIRIQPSGVQQERVLLGSDLPDPTAARREVGEWMQQHHFQTPRGARPLSVFENGVLIREWVLAERSQKSERQTTSTDEPMTRPGAREILDRWRRRDGVGYDRGGKDDLFLPMGPDSAA